MAVLSQRADTVVRDVPIPKLQDRLLDHGAVLAYVSDVGIGNPRFRTVQRDVLDGRVPGMALEPKPAAAEAKP